MPRELEAFCGIKILKLEGKGIGPRLPSRLDKQAGKAVGEVPVTTNLIGPPGWPSYILVREATAKGRVNLHFNRESINFLFLREQP